MKTVVVLQARMTSKRLPGKVLRSLAGRPMLSHQLRRLRQMQHAGELVVATTSLPTDDPVVALCRTESVRFFRGDEQDVLSRYVGAARETHADVIVRVTADCPLLDPGVCDRVVGALLAAPEQVDYAANVLDRTWPQGLDTEVFFRDVLDRMDRMGTSQMSREHVTWFARRERPELFRLASIRDTEDHSDLRWTVDTEEDFGVVESIYAALGLGERVAPYAEILQYVVAHPAISRGNAHVSQRNA